jgi:UDP-N-acetylmuramate--alanine ligase
VNFGKARRLHFVGIGGSGMSGIAEVLLNLGYPVSGSDAAASDVTRRLRTLGAAVHVGHAADNVAGADVVVVSSAVRPDNPEVVEARRLRIPVIPRAEMLDELMRMKQGVAVAGAHGKTTTTALVAAVADAAGLDPTVVIGGRVRALRSGAKLGHGDLMIVEADESDRSFLKMSPTIAVVTNIDREHLDTYRDLDDISDAFVQFLSRVPFYGLSVLCTDDPGVRAILPRLDRRRLTYGLSEGAEIRATDLRFRALTSSFVARRGDEILGPVEVRLPGRHAVANCLAAIAVGLELDVPFPAIARGLASFRGVDRRLQLRGRGRGVTVLDDYGHHPTEIVATLRAVREAFDGRIVVVFQPHRYTRTRALLAEFGAAFDDADAVIVLDVYAAGEPAIAGVGGASVAQAIARHGHPSASYEPERERVAARVSDLTRTGDVVLALGAGDVYRLCDDVLRELGASRRTNGPEVSA